MTYYLFDDEKRVYHALSEDEVDAYGGSGTIVLAKQISSSHVMLEATQYYARDGILCLEVTQPLDVALKLFGTLLDADNALASGAYDAWIEKVETAA